MPNKNMLFQILARPYAISEGIMFTPEIVRIVSPNIPLPISQDIKEQIFTKFGAVSPLWREFFEHFNDSEIISWHCDEQGVFELTLAQPLRVWVSSKDEKGNIYPNGGTILILEKKVSGKICNQGKEITFDQGFILFCNVPLFGMKTVTVVRMAKLDSDKIEIEAGIKIPLIGFQSQKKQKEYSEIQKEWSEGVPLDQEVDNFTYLQTKIT